MEIELCDARSTLSRDAKDISLDQLRQRPLKLSPGIHRQREHSGEGKQTSVRADELHELMNKERFNRRTKSEESRFIVFDSPLFTEHSVSSVHHLSLS
jgi:hypothetical protein